jgi:hypothetical protein
MVSVFTSGLHGALYRVNRSKSVALLYRKARLLCQYLEETSPEISHRAGFAHDLGWLEDLGFGRAK